MSEKRPAVRLLMVDDEAEFLEASAPALTRRGFAVTCAADGSQALRRMAEAQAEVVVLDVKMPGLDGEELFRIFRQRWPGVPILMLTGHGSVRQAFRTAREGLHAYLAKPCDMDELARVAHEARSSARDEQARRRAEERARRVLEERGVD